LPDIVKFGFILMITAAIAATALGGIYTAAKPRIDEQERLREENAQKAVLPQAAEGAYVPVDTDGFEYFKGFSDKDETQLVGYTFIAEGKGYSSTIRTVVGVDLSGVVTGIKIIFQQETPGLGAKVEEVASTTTLWSAIAGAFSGGEETEPEDEIAPWFQEQFVGKTVKSLEVVKGETEDKIESLTGATISSVAVTQSVKEGIERLSQEIGGFSQKDEETVS
jgi:electron transport complex protein RnfG